VVLELLHPCLQVVVKMVLLVQIQVFQLLQPVEVVMEQFKLIQVDLVDQVVVEVETLEVDLLMVDLVMLEDLVLLKEMMVEMV
tara:strand:+ start:114 stop:362 length:249 start_codon:yes stop_codon:yes gene_type:complete